MVGKRRHCDRGRDERKTKYHVVWNSVQTDLTGTQAADTKTVDSQVIGQDHHLAGRKLQNLVCSGACSFHSQCPERNICLFKFVCWLHMIFLEKMIVLLTTGHVFL